MDLQIFDYFILPVLIIAARIIDVSLDTLRVILLSKGYKKVAPFIGFFESLVWIITITRIMENLDNWITYVAYATGFGLGNYIGMLLEERIALGNELIRIITKRDATELIQALREKGFMVTSTIGEGRDGEVGILFMVLKRKAIDDVLKIVKEHNPNAFFTIEDMRYVRELDIPAARKTKFWHKK